MKYLGQPQSGSQAGTTASHNRAGQYYRNRRKPVAPTRTPRQTELRGQFGQASRAWQSLTAGEMAAWTSFAASHPITDALGQAVVLDGHAFFVGVATSLLNVGAPLPTNVPVNTTVNGVINAQVYCDDSGNVILSWDDAATGDYVLGGLSKLTSMGVTFNKTFTQFGVGDAGDGVLDLSDQYVAIWGFPTVGRQIFARLRPVNSDGLSGTGIIIRSPVVAGAGINAPALAASTGGTSAGTWSGSGPADYYLFEKVGGVGPWVVHSTGPITAGVFTAGTAGIGNLYMARARDSVGWSDRSNVQHGS